MNSRLRILLILWLALAALICPQAALAEPDIVISNSTQENAYPESIKFQVEVASDSEISRLRLYYRIVGEPTTSYATVDFQPSGSSVSAEYNLDPRRDYIPPGVELRYYWEVEDVAGNKVRSEATNFTVTDSRFLWREVEQDNVIVAWYEGNEDFARGVLEDATNALNQLRQDAGVVVEDEQKVKILLYATQADMLGALEIGAHEWTGGRSFSALSLIVIAVSPTSSGQAFAARAVPHELSHVVVHQMTDNPFGDIPQWLSEGLAMYAEGKLEPSYQRRLDQAIKNNELLSLQTLSSNFPSDSDQAELSYAESYSVVMFIIDNYGRESMTKLLEVFSEGSTYDDATQAALGVTVKQLEKEWRASINAPETAPEVALTGVPETPAQNEPLCGTLSLGMLVLAAAAVVVGKRRQS